MINKLVMNETIKGIMTVWIYQVYIISTETILDFGLFIFCPRRKAFSGKTIQNCQRSRSRKNKRIPSGKLDNYDISKRIFKIIILI